MIEFFGWLGAFCFAICGIPQAYKSYKDGHSDGISSGLLTLWIVGEISMVIYIIPKMDAPLLLNYFGNILSVGTIIYFKVRPRYKRNL